jgi:uncharacterized C2H2 Zn-finger protein
MSSEIRTTVEAGVTFFHCPYCWRATRSKSTMRAHINAEHHYEEERELEHEDDNNSI